MRKIVNKPDWKMFVFYGLVLIPTFSLCYGGDLTFFFIIVAMLLTSVIEIPIYKFRTKKPEYSTHEAKLIGEFYSVPVAEELQKDNERTYKTIVTLNIGGFIIPLFFAFYLLFSYSTLRLEVAMLILLMTIFSYMLSEVKGGVGIVIPCYVGIFAIPTGFIFATQSELMLGSVLMLLIFVPAIFGILLGILIRLAARPKEEVGSAFFNIGGSGGSFHSVYLISFLVLLLVTVT